MAELFDFLVFVRGHETLISSLNFEEFRLSVFFVGAVVFVWMPLNGEFTIGFFGLCFAGTEWESQDFVVFGVT